MTGDAQHCSEEVAATRSMRVTRRQALQDAAVACMAAGAWPAMADARPDSWLRDTYRELHVDAHFGQVPQPYEDFDGEAAAEIFRNAGFQMVSCFAVCNAGYSYYPTAIGVKHPGLKRDFTGEMAAALKKRGIRVLAYVSAGPDRRYGGEHPDWVRVSEAPATSNRGGASQMCLNSPWVEQVHIPQQFAILNSEVLAETLAEYRALVLPEQCILGARECDAIRRFVESGGGLLVTGDTGTRDSENRPLADFALADVLGVRSLGRADVRRSFLRSSMDVEVSGAYRRIQTTTAATLLSLVPPTGAKQAPAAQPEGPGITLNQFGKGRAMYCAAPLFTAYQKYGTPALRSLAWWMLDRVHPEPRRVLTVGSVPRSIEVTVHARGADRLVHLVSRAQDFVPVEGIRVRLQSAGRPRRVREVPDGAAAGFQWRDGYVEFAARVSMHSAYLVEA